MDRVIEIDGPPVAYFEVAEGLKDEAANMYVTRLVYRTVAVMGEDEGAVRAWMDSAIESIRAACRECGAFMIWRKRPIVEFQPRGWATRPTETGEERYDWPARWKARARLVTSVPIPAEVWAALEKRDAEETRQL